MSSLKLAGCVIKDEQGKILLIHRNTSNRQQWEIPGGKVEEAEDSMHAAARELQEELGVEVKIDKLLGEKEFTEAARVMRYSWYQSKIISGNPKIMEPGIFDDMRYFHISEMSKIKLSIGAQTFLSMMKDDYDS